MLPMSLVFEFAIQKVDLPASSSDRICCNHPAKDTSFLMEGFGAMRFVAGGSAFFVQGVRRNGN